MSYLYNKEKFTPHNVAGRGLDITAAAVQVRAPSQHGISNHVPS